MDAVACRLAPSVPGLHAGFLALLPRLEAHARFAFRHYRCPHDRDDAVAEVLGLCWFWYVRLARRGTDAAAFPATLARRCCQAVKAGRRLCGQESARDVLAPTAQRRRDFALGRLPEATTPHDSAWQECLWDNTRSPVAEAAAFRCDFARWLATLADRDRHLVEDMTRGHRTRDLARRFRLSPGRVSQLRRCYHAAWRRFHGEPAPAADRRAALVG